MAELAKDQVWIAPSGRSRLIVAQDSETVAFSWGWEGVQQTQTGTVTRAAFRNWITANKAVVSDG